MLLNNNFNILPWYDSLEKQSSKKWYTFGQSWPLLCPKGQILPFQFICEELEISSNIFAVNVNTGESVDLGVRPTIQIGSQADATYYVVKMKATSIPDLAVGTYYLRFNTSLGFLYSEEITVIDDAEKHIKIQYWNEATLNFASGEINFADDFKFELYIRSTIGKPEYEFEEELTKRLGYKFIESQTSNKVYKFAFVAPEYICDAMRLIRLCDYIKLTTKFDSYNALSFAYEPKWQDQGDLAAIDVEFDTDCIIQKLESFNRRAKDSFYNALLAEIDEPVLFSPDTVAQYYTEFTSTTVVNGKLIRQLEPINEAELSANFDNIVLPTDNEADPSQKAKKITLADLQKKIGVDINELAKSFLRKDQADVAAALITFLKGIVIGKNGSGIEVLEDGSSHAIIDSLFVKLKGLFKELESDKITALKELLVGSSGHGISVLEDGSTQAVVDRLYVNIKAYFDTLETKRKTHVGGEQVISPAGIKCTKVETLDSVYRCYFKAEEDGVTINNEFTVGTLAISQECNVRIGVAQHAGNRFYWRKVVEVGTDYIDLSKDIAATDSNIPAPGDDIVALGHTDDIARQSAIVLSSVGSTSPSIIFYQGINSFSLVGKEVISLDYDRTNGHARAKIYGEAYIGDKQKTSYLSYDEVNGLVVRARKIMLESGMAIDEAINSVMKAVTDVSSQLDGSIEIWQGEFTSTDDTLQTDTVEPSKDWTTDSMRNSHLGDYLVLQNGTCYEYIYDEERVRYYWKSVTDKYLLAYLNTLDSKKVIFRVPSDTLPLNFFAGKEYAQGDLWVNAKYPEDGSTYNDEVLVCITPKNKDAAFDITHWQPAEGTKKLLKNAGINIDTREIAFTAEQFKFKNLLGELFAVLEEVDGIPTIRAELLNITGDLIAQKIKASGLDIDGKFTVEVKDGNVKVNIDGDVTCEKLYYKNASVNVLDGSIITEGGTYTLPVIPSDTSIEFRVLVPVPSRTIVGITLVCSGTDDIATNVQDTNAGVWRYQNTLTLSSNYYYRVIGIDGTWYIEKSNDLL